MSQGHLLPPGIGDGKGPADRSPAPEPAHAERARTLISCSNRGVLSTLALDPPGYPFGSVATYAIDDGGRPIVFVSTLAEHTRNAAADPRASLIVAEPVPDGSDPLAAGRVTLIGDLLEVGAEERPAVRDRYLTRNPASAYYIDFGDFAFWHRYGFDVVVGGPSGRAALRLGFDAAVVTPAAVRPAMIRLVERARGEL